jgi:hypothetical protein
MKPAAVINQGDHFVTLRATTDRPAEIQEALATRDVQHVFKGDQNQAWDAVLANHCLDKAVGRSADLTFFVQDERLGTSDARLARARRAAGRRYVLTEDYYRGRSGAVWEHQDVSHGLLFTEAVAPEDFARAGVPLTRAAALWQRHGATLLADPDWLAALAALGVVFPGHGSPAAATGQGPAVEPEGFADLSREQPDAALYYAFTKTDGLYGMVPVTNDNATLSSIPAADPEIRGGAARLLCLAAAGAMRQSGTPAHRRGVKLRARRVAEWAAAFLADRPGASVADFQAAFGEWLTREIFPADRLNLDRTSRFMHLDAEDLPALERPAETLHYFLDLALRHPAEFTAAYNDALNRVGFGLQRVKYDAATGHYTPPFFVEYAPAGPGTPVLRFGLQLAGQGPVTLTLTNPTGDVVRDYPRPIRSARDLLRALIETLDAPPDLVLVGKAATFAAELQRAPRGLGLPRQGSKYAPLVDHLVSGLRARGVLREPTGLLVRIGLNALDRLEAMGDLPLRLPAFLHGALGSRLTAREFARGWRSVAAEAEAALALLERCEVGRHVHLARLLAANARGVALNRRDGDLMRLKAALERVATGQARSLGRDLPAPAVACLERLCARRQALLNERLALTAAARIGHPGGRLVPDPERRRKLEEERERIECALLLLIAAYVRRLRQRAESLRYVNDRPYTLALYLLFGTDIFGPICRQVEFDVEYVTPALAGMTAMTPAVVGQVT